MNRRTGPAAFPELGLVDAATRPVTTRTPRARVVVRGIDGTHMGVAVGWWRALAGGDLATLDTIRVSYPAGDALRSGLEVVLAQASWIARMRSTPGGPVTVLAQFSEDPIVTTAHRALCRELAAQLDRNPDAVDFAITPINVSSLMDLIAFLGSTVEYQHKLSIADQITAFQRAVFNAEGLT